MFGETDEEACLRLRQIEILAPEINKVSSVVIEKKGNSNVLRQMLSCVLNHTPAFMVVF